MKDFLNKLLGTTTVINEAKATAKARPFWKITLIFLFVFFCGTAVTTVIQVIPTLIHIFITAKETPIEEIDVNYVPDWLNAVFLFSTVGTIIAVLIYCLCLERRRFFTLGFIKKGAIVEYLAGLIIGLVMFGSAYGIIILSGQGEFKGINPEISVIMIILFFLGFVIQGMSEEILVRGYYFVSAASTGKVTAAFFAGSGIFALLHIFNNGIHIVPLINLFLFGMFANLYFLRRGSIWGISALHTMWNFAQGNIFGCEVSGNKMGSSIFSTQTVGESTLFNGGSFGPEGGLGVTIVLSLGIIVLLFMKNKEIKAEINFDN